MLLKRFGKFGRVLWERSQGIDERDVNNDRLRKSVGVERTLAEDIHEWAECEEIIERLYPELERRLAKVKPDLLIARQGVKLKFNDFQQTTQEHVWPRLSKDDLIATARKTGMNVGEGGVRLVGLHVTLWIHSWKGNYCWGCDVDVLPDGCVKTISGLQISM
jgi:DNA polymerase-4